MRSMLFVPGDSARKIEKGLAGDADAVIIDLEDSVALDGKDAARQFTARTLAGLDAAARAAGPEIYVRVNALDTGLTDADLAAVMAGRPDGIMQPKAGGGADVRTLAAMLVAEEARHGIASGATGIVVVATETASSLFHMGSYVDAGPRLRGMAWGAEDLSADLGATTNKRPDGVYADPYRLARTLCLTGAVAASVQPIDTVFTAFRDEAGLRGECEAAVRDGFTGKMAIHPAQVAVINAVFTPSAADVARARRIVETFAEAGNPGVVGLDGEMLDRPHLTRAKRLLARAAKYA
jgi:citrate lyase subunit beta / citryl-CoA lyase